MKWNMTQPRAPDPRQPATNTRKQNLQTRHHARRTSPRQRERTTSPTRTASCAGDDSKSAAPDRTSGPRTGRKEADVTTREESVPSPERQPYTPGIYVASLADYNAGV